MSGHRLTRRLTRPRRPLLLVGIGLLVLAILTVLTVAVVDRLRERSVVAEQLTGLRVVRQAPDVAGYERSCGRDRGCVFGPAWSDDVDVAGGHDGCDTRNQILARDLTAVTIKPGTRGCVVLTGILIDPYAGTRVVFDRAHAQAVQIDHVFPLAAAWDRGAADWTLDRRRDFANDPIELLATAGSVNAAKSDRTPATWSPATPSGGCRYARQFVTIAAAYQLAVTTDDRTALAAMLTGCPG